MGIPWAEMLKEALARALKLYTPKDFLGNGQEEQLWITDLKKEDGEWKIEIEVDSTLFNVWMAANGRAATEAFLDLQDFADRMVLNVYPDHKPEDDDGE